MKYELDHNPDGQFQFVDGNPVDSLSNPFSMNLTNSGLPDGAYLVHRGRTSYVECSRCEDVEAFPPARGRSGALRRGVVEHGTAAASPDPLALIALEER